ncbi:MAG: hypothetical protein FJ297_03155 [Planctomycetes bacterium]|nr:hypothetical protein [Planctomycetota bacterium]
MKRILGMMQATLVYFLAATAAALIGLIGVLWLKGHLNRDKALDVLAAAYGVEPPAPPATGDGKDARVSYEDVLEKRAIQGMDLDLREHALDKAMTDLVNQQTRLDDDRTKYNQLLEQFEARLAELQAGAADRAMQDVLQTLVSMRAEQAKEQLLKLIETGGHDRVVTLFKMMPAEIRKKILGEFTTTERDTLHEIIQKILAGSGEGDLINAVSGQVGQFKNAQP